MVVLITEIHGLLDAIRSMYMSKRSWSWDKELEIEKTVTRCLDENGMPNWDAWNDEEFSGYCSKLFKWGRVHPTMLRFIDLSVVVEGLHRGATDDFDSHARRLDNRIIRSSTRLAEYGDEMSEWYKGKIISLDEVLAIKSVDLPDRIVRGGDVFVRTRNGYIREDLRDNNDVKRGLYMLSIPMNFTFKLSLPELGHIYRQRGSKEGGAIGNAAPELQQMMETIMDQLKAWYPQLTREYILEIQQ